MLVVMVGACGRGGVATVGQEGLGAWRAGLRVPWSVCQEENSSVCVAEARRGVQDEPDVVTGPCTRSMVSPTDGQPTELRSRWAGIAP